MMPHLLAVLAVTVVGHTATTTNTLGEVNFAFDKSDPLGDVPVLLKHAATYAAAHPSERIVLDAHCDPIGAGPYNVALSIRRATAVRDQLAGMGVPREQIVLAAFGKDGQRRATHAADRRVTVWSTTAPLASVIDSTFAARGTSVTWDKPLTVAQIEQPSSPNGEAVASR
jgi:hypothetical protein